MPIKKVNTVTLVRGAILSLRLPMWLQVKPEDADPIRFEYGVPKVIANDKVLNYLDDMFDEIEDGEGEVYEKPTFSVKRGVAAPEPENSRSRTRRLDADRPIKRRIRRRK